MTTTNVVKLPSIQRMVCSSCGAEANASCNCGQPYVPAGKRIAEYDKANPGKSTRQVAADLGLTSGTITKARKSGASTEAPATVTGRDGKQYAARRRVCEEVDEEMENAASATMRRRIFFNCAENALRKAKQGAGLAHAKPAEIDDDILAMLDAIIEAWSKLRDTISNRRS